MAAGCLLKWTASCAVHGAVAGALLAAAQPAFAQQAAYPAKTIRLIASQAPGGGIDSVARIVSSKLSEAVGQSVIVDNRAGANGSIAAELTAKSPPDGYTVMLGGVGNLGANAFFIKQMGYDPLQDLKTPQMIVARLNKEFVQILNRPDTGDALLKLGLEVWTSTPEAFGAYIKSEYDKWGRIIREAGITAN